ncbi:uncharacterized protein LOC143083190 [Mytilus galloprovincialis]|uniref:uncharacterized protein LOC143083190 n=1 Tax=Mytilus galloprovincialis TaxID=29158 RepID=UPI003F7B4707
MDNSRKQGAKRRRSSPSYHGASKNGSPSRSFSSSTSFEDTSWTSIKPEHSDGRSISLNWTKTDFEEDCGMYYDINSSPIYNLFSLPSTMAEKRTIIPKICLNDLPEIVKTLVLLTKEKWNFSLNDCDGYTYKSHIERAEAINEAKRACQHFLSCFNDIEELISSLPDIDKRCIYQYYNSALEFLQFSLPMFLSKKYDDIRKEDFQWLFTKFSEIFLLKPQPGDLCKRKMKIKKEYEIECEADIRFTCHPSPVGYSPPTCCVVMVTEIAKENTGSSRNGEIDIHALSDKVLTQMVADLLFESEFSIFYPGVIGMLCIGTKLIFLYCEIPGHKLLAIKKNGKLEETEKAYIQFTRAFDYLVADDRNEILDYLFWLGYIQSSGYFNQ